MPARSRSTSKTTAPASTRAVQVPTSAEVRTHEATRQPTETDGSMLIQLASLNAQLGLGSISSWLWSDEFEPDYEKFRRQHARGSERDTEVHQLLGWYETVGTLWKNGLISSPLLFDWLSLSLAWQKLEGICRAEREESGEPRLWENFEMMALAQRAM